MGPRTGLVYCGKGHSGELCITSWRASSLSKGSLQTGQGQWGELCIALWRVTSLIMGLRKLIKVNGVLQHCIMKSHESDHGITANWSRSMGCFSIALWRVTSLIMGLLQTDQGQWGASALHYEEPAVWSWDHCKLVQVNGMNSAWHHAESAVWPWDHCKLVKVNGVLQHCIMKSHESGHGITANWSRSCEVPTHVICQSKFHGVVWWSENQKLAYLVHAHVLSAQNYYNCFQCSERIQLAHFWQSHIRPTQVHKMSDYCINGVLVDVFVIKITHVIPKQHRSTHSCNCHTERARKAHWPTATKYFLHLLNTTHYSYSGKYEWIRKNLVRMRWRIQPSCLYKTLLADKYGKIKTTSGVLKRNLQTNTNKSNISNTW